MRMKMETKVRRIIHIQDTSTGVCWVKMNHENPEDKISKIQVPRCKQNFHWLGTPAELAENIQEHDWNHWMWSMVNMRTLTWELTQIRMMSSLHISPFKLVGMGYKWELNYGNIALCELIWSPSGWAHFIQFSLVITPFRYTFITCIILEGLVWAYRVGKILETNYLLSPI